MDMCYDGALVMPSNYAVMSEEEMAYVEGGAFSYTEAKKLVYIAIGAVIGVFVENVATKLMEPLISACATWIKGLVETAILTVMCYPEKVAAVALAVGMLAVAGYGMYRVGRKKQWW